MGFFQTPHWLQVTVGLNCLGVYAIVAGVLTYRSVGRFDLWLDRPRMFDEAPSQVVHKPQPQEELAETVLQS